MALTAYAASPFANVPNETDEIELGTITGGAGGDNVTLPASALQALEILLEDVSPPNSHSPAGVAVKTTVTITIDLATLGEAGASTLYNELTNSQIIAYVKYTWVGGKFIELDSGVTGKAIVYFTGSLISGEEGMIYRLVATRTLPKNNIVIS